ncbi:hypothetical protein AZ21_2264 [Bordetella bronchiseptica B20-10725633]|nr:hypothetical protein AZ21_2264 [Bordetella bronchiseptica B20-10725633]
MGDYLPADLAPLLFSLNHKFVIAAVSVIVATWEASPYAGRHRKHLLL